MARRQGGLRANWTDGRDYYYIPQGLLEIIGIGISECPLCKEIHRRVKLEREGGRQWIVVTHDNDLVAHIKGLLTEQRCPVFDRFLAIGVLNEPL